MQSQGRFPITLTLIVGEIILNEDQESVLQIMWGECKGRGQGDKPYTAPDIDFDHWWNMGYNVVFMRNNRYLELLRVWG
jgi:hypothetical protein